MAPFAINPPTQFNMKLARDHVSKNSHDSSLRNISKLKLGQRQIFSHVIKIPKPTPSSLID